MTNVNSEYMPACARRRDAHTLSPWETHMYGDPQRQYTLDDYHRIEESSMLHHEFHAGEIFAMAGGSVAHNHVSVNVLAFLRTALVATPCSAFGSDLRLSTPAGLLTYPDVMVICGPIDLVPGREDEVTNPVLIFEVLSAATRRYDRGEKFTFYKSIPTLLEYVLIEPKELLVEQHVRGPNEVWRSRDHTSGADVVNLHAVTVDLPLQEIYRRVFETGPPR